MAALSMTMTRTMTMRYRQRETMPLMTTTIQSRWTMAMPRALVTAMMV
jgi:hypothetical protein